MRFTVRNCRVELSFLFVAVVTFYLLIDRTGIAGVGLVAAVLHEIGHLAAMCLFSVPPEKIRLKPFGIEIAEKRGVRRSYGRDAAISLSGPAANLLFFALCCLGYSALSWEYLFHLAAANLLLALLNVLPVEPLDGGQALYALLCLRLRMEHAQRVVEIVSFCVVFPIAVLGFLVLLRSGYNFSLLLIGGYLILMLVLKKGRYF